MSLLSNRALMGFLEEEVLFKPKTWSKENLRAAKYDLRLAGDLLIRPGNVFISNQPPGDGKPFVLEPGQTALISTMERLVVPPELAGIIGPRLGTSETGLYIFGGMLVDPGFGYVWNDAANRWKPDGRPLVFHAANLGKAPIPMVPGVQKIASISFITVDSPYDRETFPKDFQTSSADVLISDVKEQQDTRQYALGFLAELEELSRKVDKIEVSSKQLNLFGTIVIGAALFGAIVSVLFGFAENGHSRVDLTWGSVAVVSALVLGGILVVALSSYLVAKAAVAIRLQRRRG